MLTKIAEYVQEDFEELVGISNDKKHFIRALTEIFTLLLNTKVDIVDKIKKTLKIAIETALKLWQEPRRLPITMPTRIGNKNILNRCLRILPFQIKRIMPETKRVSVKKNRTNVKRNER